MKIKKTYCGIVFQYSKNQTKLNQKHISATPATTVFNTQQFFRTVNTQTRVCIHISTYACSHKHTHTHGPCTNSAHWSALLTGEVLYFETLGFSGELSHIQLHDHFCITSKVQWSCDGFNVFKEQRSPNSMAVARAMSSRSWRTTTASTMMMMMPTSESQIGVSLACVDSHRCLLGGTQCSSLGHVLVKGRTFLEAFYLSLEADNCIPRMQCCHSL